jgi:hypothetical protein
MKPPLKETLPSYYQTYYDNNPTADIYAALVSQCEVIAGLAALVSAEKELFAYAPGKWSIREVIGHIIDTERIFSYRILRLSRKDATELPGFDENDYVRNFAVNRFTLESLLQEWLTVRSATLCLLERLEDEDLDFTGTANGIKVSSRMIAYFCYAHASHHLRILNERYL